MEKYVKIDDAVIETLIDNKDYVCDRCFPYENKLNTRMTYRGSIIKAHYLQNGKLLLGIYIPLTTEEQIKQIKL